MLLPSFLFLRKFFLSLCLITVLAVNISVAFAQDYSKDIAKEKEAVSSKVEEGSDKLKDSAKDFADDVQKQADKAKDKLAEHADKVSDQIDESVQDSSLMHDIQKARDIIMNGTGGNSFARGMLIALLQPIFIASMFCLGLWAGQMSEKLKHIWVLPVIVYVATVIGAFITAYHPEWKPDEEHYKFLKAMQSTETVGVIIGLFLGIAVALQFVLPSFFAMIGAIVIGIILGFSQTSDIGSNHSVMQFWAGFGLTGLLVNIFGIGFETFFQSINLKVVTRLLGVATAVLSVYLGAKLL